FGGHENLAAVEFLKQLNLAAYRDHPDTQTIAEESTAWPMVSRPIYLGGLGFGLKWNMGWMHDTLKYFQQDPVHRKYHHSRLTFSIWYAFSENFVLPLSHDEVVHGKGSLIGKMPGDEWQQFASLRLLFGYMWTHPGKKLLFMGGEFGQRREWQHEESLEWHVLEYPLHAGVQRWVRDLNRLYRSTPALHQLEFSEGGFQWIDCDDADGSVISFLRRGAAGDPLWFKDDVIYEVHVRAFFDGNDDGCGDLAGLTSKLEYIQDLGVNTVWLLPFYPSPGRDDGYDIADYRNIHPAYGTRAEF